LKKFGKGLSYLLALKLPTHTVHASTGSANSSGMQSIYNHRLKKIFGIQWTEIPAPILKRGVFF
jgi:hypothetical protein